MRPPESINREIQDLDKLILSAEELVLQFPNDNFIKLNITQLTHRKDILIEELELSLMQFGRHSLKYIFSDIKEKINLDILLKGLSAFKTVIDKTFENITSGKSNQLPVFFNTVFSGSYGIQLSTPFEDNLFEHNYGKSLQRTIGIVQKLTSSSVSNIKNIIEKDFSDDKKLLAIYSSFFKKIHQNNQRIQIIWNSPLSGTSESVLIEPEKAYKIYSIFIQHETTEETVEYYGVLKGLSLIRFKVEFILDYEGKRVITASFDEKMIDKVKEALDKIVLAKFKLSIKNSEVNPEGDKKYELLDISDQQDSF